MITPKKHHSIRIFSSTSGRWVSPLIAEARAPFAAFYTKEYSFHLRGHSRRTEGIEPDMSSVSRILSPHSFRFFAFGEDVDVHPICPKRTWLV